MMRGIPTNAEVRVFTKHTSDSTPEQWIEADEGSSKRCRITQLSDTAALIAGEKWGSVVTHNCLIAPSEDFQIDGILVKVFDGVNFQIAGMKDGPTGIRGGSPDFVTLSLSIRSPDETDTEIVEI